MCDRLHIDTTCSLTNKERCNLTTEIDKSDKPDPFFINLEYQECVSVSRFVVGNRFNYFVSFTTFFVVLVGGFYYVGITEKEILQELKPWFLLAIAGFGLYTSIIVLILEQRGIQIYQTADNRAAELERLMGIKDGIRQILVMSQRKKKLLGVPLTYTFGIKSFYWLIFVIWTNAVIASIFQVILLLF